MSAGIMTNITIDKLLFVLIHTLVSGISFEPAFVPQTEPNEKISKGILSKLIALLGRSTDKVSELNCPV